MHITIEDASKANMLCKDITLWEIDEDEFMSEIGSDHDIDLTFK